MIALILAPTLIAVVLGGLRVLTSVSSAAEFQRVWSTSTLVRTMTDLAHELELERDLSIGYVAAGRPARGFGSVGLQQARVDEVALRIRAEIAGVEGERLQPRAGKVRDRLDRLLSLRKEVFEGGLVPSAIGDRYAVAINDVLALHGEAGQGSTDGLIVAGARALRALAVAKSELSKQRGILTFSLHAGRFVPEAWKNFNSARVRHESEIDTFYAETPNNIRELYIKTVNGTKVNLVAIYSAWAVELGGRNLALLSTTPARRQNADRWFDAASDTINRIRVVEKELADSLVSRSQRLQEAEQRDAWLTAGLILALLILVLLVTLAMAQTLVGPLRRLRTEALAIAGARLPEMVQTLRESGDTVVAPKVRPIGVDNRDEIGEVARAFDEVHREAVRLAADEAKLRGNVNAMFVNLSRRSQTLVERQIDLIDDLEQGEQDDARLANLFKLDHLATRMRRNSENLLVLAGQEASRRWSGPVELVDVVRASLAEIENYERVALRIRPDVAVVGQAVNDVIHLFAELVENAIYFSSKDTEVEVGSNTIESGGVALTVDDLGIGMSAEELADANRRLADPPVVDVSVSRRMGLFVVGRLAMRHGIGVRLQRRGDGNGLRAVVLLPPTLITRSDSVFPADAGWHPGAVEINSPWPDVAPPVSVHYGAPPAFSGFRHNGVRDPLGPVRPESPRHASAWPSADSAPGSTTGPVSWPSSHVSDTGPIRTGTGPIPWQRAEDDNGPIPDFRSGPLGPEEFLPIFAALESDWFQRADEPAAPPDPPVEEDLSAKPAPGPAEPVPEPPGPEKEPAWRSPGDAGWAAATAAVQDTAFGGLTAAGLPRRVPRANLVPGAAPEPGQAPPVLSPEQARSRLSGLQRGVLRGRAEIRGWSSPSSEGGAHGRAE
ncbi:sensor histidine kinase [Rhizohabitans arisaemae]|uniref:sensor histidine kinase n=1 Tax=Rhizohabitans arisaemae TaxID=2720610 RepID=UPI0024B23417|nr:nitrate- and nitrite sensing domain-containing protein [Rhizohabitans arisaemae]